MGSQRAYSKTDLDLLERQMQFEAHDSFHAFRRYINPKMKKGWWQRHAADQLLQWLADYHAGKRPTLVIQAPPQHGKLLAHDTPVFTPEGWRRHGDLVPGDYVYHPSGKAVQVLALSDEGEASLRVRLSNGDEVYCHPRHEWTVYSRNKKRWETMETQQMLMRGRRSADRNPLYTGTQGKRGCHYVYQLPAVTALDGCAKDLPLDPYVLGVWLGDGTQTKPYITHAPSDEPVIDKLKRRGWSARVRYIHATTGVISEDYGPELRTALEVCGVFTKRYGERRKHIPDCYLSASITQRLDLLAGLIDTDGYTYQRNGRVVFTTSDTALADSFCALLSTFGWNFSRVVEQPKLSSSGIQGTKPYEVIGFNPTLAIPCALERKCNRPSNLPRRVAITAIDEVAPRPGRCIQVDSSDGLYLVGRTMQPTHNSNLVVDFVGWMIGKHPELKYLYASVSKRLSTRANLMLQRTMDSDKFRGVFPHVRLTPRQIQAGTERRTRSQDLLEFLGDGGGSFRNVTVNGAIVGEGLDIGIIDDPIKGRETANSETIRNKTWDWFTDDFLTRFADNGALIIILTRWHDDDPVGRLIKGDKEGRVKVLRYPALATADAKLMPDDPRVPGSGNALFSEHKSKSFLEERRDKMAPANWSSLYQQDPYVIGGNLFKGEWWRFYEALPRFKYRICYADTAQKTKEQNDYTVLQCWGVTADGLLHLIDQVRDKWESPDLRTNARAFWRKHKAVPGSPLRAFKVEDKVSGTGLIQELKREGIPMIGIPRDKDKVQRANDAAPSIQAGLVYLPKDAPWLSDYLLEFAQFPNGVHDDQVDPTLDAIIENLSSQAYSLEGLVG